MDGVGLTVTSIGAILVYAGIKGYSLLDVVRNVITGKPITENVAKVPIGRTDVPSEVTGETTDGGASGEGTSSQRADANKAHAKIVASAWRWDTGLEWNALVDLWTRESSWDNYARNKDSGAYGIPQALPFTKMDKAAWPEDAGGTSDANMQIVWGLNYIDSRYRSPIFALAHHKQNGWY